MTNILATPAISTGYIALIVMWSTGPAAWWRQQPLAAVGQMALTNCLLESVIGATNLICLRAVRPLRRSAPG